jgi:hypothetical protein
MPPWPPRPGCTPAHWGRLQYMDATQPLNVYTGQNPRRRVVSVKTSQMRTLCTLIWRKSCLLVYIVRQLLS